MKDIKKDPYPLLKMKNTMFEMKNILNGIKSKLDITDQKVSKFEDLATESIQYETQRKKG